MKKATLTIGLFALVVALTSFTTPETTTLTIAENTIYSPIDGNGSQDTGGHRKSDFSRNEYLVTQVLAIDGNGSQDTGGHRKSD